MSLIAQIPEVMPWEENAVGVATLDNEVYVYEEEIDQMLACGVHPMRLVVIGPKKLYTPQKETKNGNKKIQ